MIFRNLQIFMDLKRTLVISNIFFAPTFISLLKTIVNNDNKEMSPEASESRISFVFVSLNNFVVSNQIVN